METSLPNTSSGLVRSVVEFTRPANTDPYTSGAVVSDSTTAPSVLEFGPVVRENGGDGLILGIRHTKSGAGAESYRLTLFSSAVTPANDGTILPVLLAQRGERVAEISWAHSVPPAGSDCSDACSFERSIPFACASFSRGLWGVLVAADGFTPLSAAVHRLELMTLPLN